MVKNFDINNSDDFEQIINKIRLGRLPPFGEQYQELYRGQSKDSYVLKSGISRYVNSIAELKKLESNIISNFKKMVFESSITEKYIQLSDNSQSFENEWRWIEQIQHYGIPTRLLDWTLDPKVALFFAVESNQNDVGQFWIFKSPLNWSCDDHFVLNPFDNKIDIISNSSFYVEDGYKDKVAEQRRSFQSGKFTFQDYEKTLIPMEKQSFLQDKMIKYTINPKSKKKLIEYLFNYNISKESIYVKYDNEIESLVKEIKEKFNIK